MTCFFNTGLKKSITFIGNLEGRYKLDPKKRIPDCQGLDFFWWRLDRYHLIGPKYWMNFLRSSEKNLSGYPAGVLHYQWPKSLPGKNHDFSTGWGGIFGFGFWFRAGRGDPSLRIASRENHYSMDSKKIPYASFYASIKKGVTIFYLVTPW